MVDDLKLQFLQAHLKFGEAEYFSAHTKWQSWERRCLVEQWKSPPGKGVPGKHESIRSNFSPLFTWTCREYPLLSFIYHLLSGTHRFIDPWPLKIGRLTDSFLSEASKASMYGTVDAEVGTGTLHCCTTWGPMFSGCWVWFPAVGLSSIHRIPTPHGIHLQWDWCIMRWVSLWNDYKRGLKPGDDQYALESTNKQPNSHLLHLLIVLHFLKGNLQVTNPGIWFLPTRRDHVVKGHCHVELA